MQPDIIITDWRMPEMDGIDFIKTLKSNPKTQNIIVIMTTAILTSATDLKTALDAGAIDFIRKPFDDLELIARTGAMIKFADTYKTLINNQKIILEKEAIIEKQKAEILQLELDHRNGELLTNNLKLAQLIELNNKLMVEFQNIADKTNENIAIEVRGLISKYKYTTAEETWNDFQIKFETSYPNFFKNLSIKYPNLTSNEKRLCAFMRMNMTIKEILALTFQSHESIRKARIRLRQKMNIEKDSDLNSYLISI